MRVWFKTLTLFLGAGNVSASVEALWAGHTLLGFFNAAIGLWCFYAGSVNWDD